MRLGYPAVFSKTDTGIKEIPRMANPFDLLGMYHLYKGRLVAHRPANTNLLETASRGKGDTHAVPNTTQGGDDFIFGVQGKYLGGAGRPWVSRSDRK